MAEVSDWNPIDDNNNSAPPVGWPEGMVPSAVNNAARAMQGALRREHDRIVAGTQDLPYVKRAGDTMTGDLSISSGGLSLTALSVRNNGSNSLEVNHASGGGVISRGSNSGYFFIDRSTPTVTWSWLAFTGGAHLQWGSGGAPADVFSVTNAGAVGALASFNAPIYQMGGVTFASRDGGGNTVLNDNTGSFAIILGNTDSYYKNDNHSFQNNGGTPTASIDSGGNISAAGFVNAVSYRSQNVPIVAHAGDGSNFFYDGSGELFIQAFQTQTYYKSDDHSFQNNAGASTFSVNSSGNVGVAGTLTVGGAVSAANLNTGGTVSAGYVTSSGNVNAAATVTAAGVTATGTVQGSQLTSTGNASIAGTCTANTFVGAFSAPPGSTISSGAGGTVSTTNLTSTTITNSGTINTANLSASSNVTAAGTVTGNSVVCGSGVFQNTGPSNLIGTVSFGPSGSWARIDATASYNVTGAWQTFSDRAVKEAITPYTAGLAEIEQLEPVSYTYTSEIEQVPVTRYGLVAQDVAPIVPEMVGEGVTPGGTTMATLNGGHATWLLINAVKELSAKVTALEAQLAAA